MTSFSSSRPVVKDLSSIFAIVVLFIAGSARVSASRPQHLSSNLLRSEGRPSTS